MQQDSEGATWPGKPEVMALICLSLALSHTGLAGTTPSAPAPQAQPPVHLHDVPQELCTCCKAPT